MNTVNQINVDALKTIVARIMENLNEGKAEYAVRTTWDGQLVGRVHNAVETTITATETKTGGLSGSCSLLA